MHNSIEHGDTLIQMKKIDPATHPFSDSMTKEQNCISSITDKSVTSPDIGQFLN